MAAADPAIHFSGALSTNPSSTRPISKTKACRPNENKQPGWSPNSLSPQRSYEQKFCTEIQGRCETLRQPEKSAERGFPLHNKVCRAVSEYCNNPSNKQEQDDSRSKVQECNSRTLRSREGKFVSKTEESRFRRNLLVQMCQAYGTRYYTDRKAFFCVVYRVGIDTEIARTKKSRREIERYLYQKYTEKYTKTAKAPMKGEETSESKGEENPLLAQLDEAYNRVMAEFGKKCQEHSDLNSAFQAYRNTLPQRGIKRTAGKVPSSRPSKRMRPNP